MEGLELYVYPVCMYLVTSTTSERPSDNNAFLALERLLSLMTFPLSFDERIGGCGATRSKIYYLLNGCTFRGDVKRSTVLENVIGGNEIVTTACLASPARVLDRQNTHRMMARHLPHMRGD